MATRAYQLLFAEQGLDPIGKTVRIGSDAFEVVGVFGKAPSPGNFSVNQDDFAVIPYTTYQRVFGLRVVQNARGMMPTAGAVLGRAAAAASRRPMPSPRSSASCAAGIGCRLDEPNDFDIVTQDALMQVWNQISQATFFALVVISSIALMVGGIGVMAIMSISVTERTREIGVRRALGARRREVLFQFLTEAAVLTSVGGVLGILLGSAHRAGRALPHRIPRLASRSGPSRWASASPRLSASSSACIPPSAPPASIRSKRCGTSSSQQLP